MKIKVEFLGFHFALKERDVQLDIEGTALSDVIRELTDKLRNFRDGVMDESGRIDGSVVILVNGEEVVSRGRLDEMTLRESDTVTFMMMAGGG